MTAAEQSGFERLRFWQGQTLRSRDLNDQLAQDASLRWWHNRAVHSSWGVVWGLETQVVDQKVSVSRGLAFDSFGRELILPQARRLPLPPSETDRTWELLLRAVPRALGRPVAAELAWTEARPAPDPRHGIPIVQGKFVGGSDFKLDTSRRPRLIGRASRPKLGNGSTIRGKTDWRTWTFPPGALLGGGGIEVQIDTKAAGFERTPCYFASLQGNAFKRLGLGFVLMPFARVTQATSVSFIFNIWLPFSGFAQTTGVAFTPSIGPIEFARRELSVCWLGIERRAAESAFKAKVNHDGA